jgi:DNA-binding LytR/AlgR family response regulator
MIIRIAVCDDNEHIGFEIEEYAQKICSVQNIKAETDVYFSGEELCKKLATGECYDLIFLDIEMEKINGIEVGLKIRDVIGDELIPIVYISWNREYALELFKIHPLDFLIKPLTIENVSAVINRYLKITNLRFANFSYKYGHDNYILKLSDIRYFESNDRKIIIHKTTGDDEFYGSLEKIYNDQLKQNNFLYIHKSFIVNYDYVSAFEYEQVILNDKQTVLPIAQPKRKEIRQRQKEIETLRS